MARGQADATAVRDAWMHSAGHRATILNCDFHALSVGSTGRRRPLADQDLGY